MFVDSATPWLRMHRAFDALLDDRDATARRLFEHASDGTNQTVTQVLGYVILAVTVLLIIWSWRSAHNARALGRVGARLSPGWAIAAWLIPLASLRAPVPRRLRPLAQLRIPTPRRGDAWRARPAVPLVVGWWIAYVGRPGARRRSRSSSRSRAPPAARPPRRCSWSAHAVGIAGALLTIVVVRRITERQEAQQAADPAPHHPPAAAPVPRAHHRRRTRLVRRPGPTSYDHRYWDGTAWTEHVSRGGVASIAPVTPPDWYPDPTGRFHWRYWTGSEWTEHVSRDQELFVDPLDGDAT